MMGLWRKIPEGWRSLLGLWAAILALFAIGGMFSPGFFSVSQGGAIFRSASFIGMVAMGQTLAILIGGIDLSVGPLVSLGSVFGCLMLAGKDENNLWAISVILLIGLTAGILNGIGVSLLGISPMVMTLATGAIITGAVLIYSQGAPTGNASPALRAVGVGFTWSIPNSVLIWLALGTTLSLVLKYTTFGRGVYYIGANETAAGFSGLRVNFIKTAVYALSGLTAALTGIIIAGYTSVAFVAAGRDYPMQSIAAAVIGGVAMTGGRGGYGGAAAGAVLLCLIESLLTNMNMQEPGRKIMNGLVIVMLMTFYYRKRLGSGSKKKAAG
ncbi:MAG: ABC transporter permease [Planctomycetota bacterium]|nr:ABC transporter permease [Planctomycetota bacterium]